MSARRYRKVEGYVVCDFHGGEVHRDDPDPYDEFIVKYDANDRPVYDPPEGCRLEWRPVYELSGEES